jgi:hypothetical protein
MKRYDIDKYTLEQVKELQTIINRYYAKKRKEILNGDTSHNSHVCMRNTTKASFEKIKDTLNFSRQDLFSFLIDKYADRLIGGSLVDLIKRQNKEGFSDRYPIESKKMNAQFCRHKTLNEDKSSSRVKSIPVAIRPSLKTKLMHISFFLKKPITIILDEMIEKEMKTLNLTT